MNSLDEQIEVLTGLLKARGVVVGIDPNAPDYVKMAWINMILNGPDWKEDRIGKPGGQQN
jgi:hypothetical protein